MKVYVIGKWEEKSSVREVIYYIKSLGHKIVHDWTIQEDTKDKRELCAQAINDIAGVKDSDVVVAVLTKEDKYLCASPNRYSEIGIAIGSGVPIYVVGKPRKDFIFVHHPLVQVFDKMEDLPL